MQAISRNLQLNPQFIYNGGNNPKSVVLDFGIFEEMLGLLNGTVTVSVRNRRQREIDFAFPEGCEQLDLW